LFGGGIVKEKTKMKTYTAKIKGANAMLQNRLGKDLLDEIKTIKKEDLTKWENDNWHRKTYQNENGEYIFPENSIHAFLMDAAKKHTSRPPKSVGRTWTNYIKSSTIIPEAAKITPAGEVIQFGTMVNGNPSSNKKGSKVWKVRPLFSQGWTATIKITDLVGLLTTSELKAMLETGGKFVGIGDWRPSHGRFEVISVKEE